MRAHFHIQRSASPCLRDAWPPSPSPLLATSHLASPQTQPFLILTPFAPAFALPSLLHTQIYERAQATRLPTPPLTCKARSLLIASLCRGRATVAARWRCLPAGNPAAHVEHSDGDGRAGRDRHRERSRSAYAGVWREAALSGSSSGRGRGMCAWVGEGSIAGQEPAALAPGTTAGSNHSRLTRAIHSPTP